jgi:putative DNA primase/helicase
LRGEGKREAEILEELTRINAECCKPPLPADDVARIAASAMRYQPNDLGMDATEVGLAVKFQQWSIGTVRYLPSSGRFVLWDGERWCIDENGTMMVENIGAFCRYLKDNMGVWKEGYERKQIRNLVKKLHTKQGEKNLLELLKTRPGMPIAFDKFDQDENLLQVSNGVVDLTTGDFRPARMEDYCLKTTPVLYQPDADCPEFKKLLLWAMSNDRDCADFLQRLCGYMAMGHAKEEVLPIFQGNGANGKSTIREAIRLVLGEYAVVAPPGLLVERKSGAQTNDIARLAGARVTWVSETDETDKLAESTVKYLTQQEPITARFLYQENFTFKPRFVCVLATNHQPIVRGSDHGIWRRLVLIPFNQTLRPEEINNHFVDKMLKPELPGILNWMIAGAVAYNKTGLKIPDAIKEATNEYKENSDYYKQFITDCVVAQLGSEVATAEFMPDFSNWYRSTTGEEVPKYLNWRGLRKALLESGYKAYRRSKVRGFKDIALLQNKKIT